MDFDFTSRLDRRGQDALAVDALGSGTAPGLPDPGFDPIPMWVADMNFPLCPSITKALEGRLTQPHFGYFMPREEYFDAIIRWHCREKGVTDLLPQHIGHENGVLGGLVSALKPLCPKGKKVLLHSPTYIGFTHALEDNAWPTVLSPLRLDGQGLYRMDFAHMESAMAQGDIGALILCSPHNPTGRVWERWELEACAALCERYAVPMISDEIWSDILRPGAVHIPTQSVSPYAHDHTVALYAPSKTFNLAGLVGSYHVIYDPAIREAVMAAGNATHYNGMNTLSMYALLGAYSDTGRAWKDQLCRVIAQNADLTLDFLARRAPDITLSRPQGTYMLFWDCTQWCARTGKSLDDLLHACWRVGVALQDGRPFHGPCHLRVNLALPTARVEEALDRLDRYVLNV